MGRNGACPDYATKLFGFKVCRFVMVAAFVLPVSSLKSGMLFTKAFSSTSQLIHNRGSDLLRQRSSKSRMSSLKAIYDVNRRNILALDFDGVVCASSVESSFSSIIAAEKFWPEACRIMKTRDVKSSYSPIETEAQDSTFRMVRSAVNELRPIVETGFENMLLVRAILEEIKLTGGINTQNLMNRWSPAYRDQLMSQYNTDKEELVTFFGKTRDDLIAEDLKAWVGLNKVYPCISECLSDISPRKLDFTIITTKQERFVKAILQTNLITPPENGNIYDLENPFGPKTKVIAALLDKYNKLDNIKDSEIGNKGVKIHFVEDRFETLLAVMKISALDNVQLYLVDWGYNTEIQREEARRLSPRIKLINGEEFKSLAAQFIS